MNFFPFVGSTEDILEHTDILRTSDMAAANASAKPYQHFSNTTVHVCWHRNTTVGKEDYQKALMVKNKRIFVFYKYADLFYLF